MTQTVFHSVVFIFFGGGKVKRNSQKETDYGQKIVNYFLSFILIAVCICMFGGPFAFFLFNFGVDIDSAFKQKYGIVTERNESIIKKSKNWIEDWTRWKYLWIGEIEDYEAYMTRQEEQERIVIEKQELEENATTLNTRKKKVPMIALYKLYYHDEDYIEIAFYEKKDGYVACYDLHPYEDE